jgi:hypothetical protein
MKNDEIGTVVTLPPADPVLLDAARTLATGVQVARRIEDSADRARRARAHAKRGKKCEARRGARRQLRRLLRVLHDRQVHVLSRGILPEDHHTLAANLQAIDRALEEFLASRRPGKASLTRPLAPPGIAQPARATSKQRARATSTRSAATRVRVVAEPSELAGGPAQ